MSTVKMICIDVDGTLLDDKKRIPLSNRNEIRRAANMGIRVAITSGRIAPSIRNFMNELGINGAVSSLGGSMLEDENGAIIEEHTLDEAVCSQIIGLAIKHGVTLLAYRHHNWYADPANADPSRIELETRATNIPGVLADNLNIRPNKMLVSEKDTAKLQDFLNILQTACDPTKVKFSSSGPANIEVMPPLADKGNAVRGLCKYYGIDRSEVMVCGDYYNDIPMFKEAGIGVAAANAPDEVKAQATYVTRADNNEGVVADAIVHFIK